MKDLTEWATVKRDAMRAKMILHLLIYQGTDRCTSQPLKSALAPSPTSVGFAGRTLFLDIQATAAAYWVPPRVPSVLQADEGPSAIRLSL